MHTNRAGFSFGVGITMMKKLPTTHVAGKHIVVCHM
jgi:hypothetical protein